MAQERQAQRGRSRVGQAASLSPDRGWPSLAGREAARFLRSVRARLGWTLERLAAALGASLATLGRFARGGKISPLWHMRLEVLARPAAARSAAPSTLGQADDARPADRLRIVPLTLEQARDFIARHHRHHRPPTGAKFAVGAAQGGQLVGVATVGRPVARMLDDGRTLEVTRVATDGTRNACSLLYAAAWRAARALGYLRLITYTLAEECGASLRAAGWRPDKRVAGRSWSCASRPREDRHPLGPKMRWSAAPADAGNPTRAHALPDRGRLCEDVANP